MTILSRRTRVKCDGGACDATATLDHDLELECDAGYGFSRALGRAGWGDVWLDNTRGYGHLCPACFGKRTALAVDKQRRREARLAKRMGHA